jgi:YggT family protein
MSNNIDGAGQHHSTTTPFLLAMAIPGNSLPEQIIIGGFGNFISIYNTVITGRILLSWFPQAAGVAALRPIYQITDPYLNLFRGIIPPIFGLDLSPILAFVTLNLLQSSSISLAATTTMMDDDEGKSVNGSGMEKGTMMTTKSSIKVTNKVGRLTTMK